MAAPDPTPAVPRRILPAIVVAQFAGTSLWFAVNAVMPDLQREAGFAPTAVGWLTSVVQLGFIIGTLVFALLAIADRFSPRRVFLLCALAGAACTVAAALLPPQPLMLGMLRALTGFFLAGIYPVGMKIAASWYTRGLGAALGLLIGALVLGSAAPHGLRALGASGAFGALGTPWPWQAVMLSVAALAAAGGLMLHALVPDNPHLPRLLLRGGVPWASLASLWRDAKVRASVFGYFGHMWELYTLWVLMPAIVASRVADAAQVSLLSFLALGAGAVGCAAGGWVAQRVGSARVAAAQLGTSGLCCLAAPFMLGAPDALFFAWLVLWGITVAGDSPQFSTLTARNAPRDAVGTVLTLTNSIGFAISIVSIQLFVGLSQSMPLAALLPWLAIGPALGLAALRPLVRERA
jgi:MFS transporter, DHA1 family, inner membrane transport protein